MNCGELIRARDGGRDLWGRGIALRIGRHRYTPLRTPVHLRRLPTRYGRFFNNCVARLRTFYDWLNRSAAGCAERVLRRNGDD